MRVGVRIVLIIFISVSLGCTSTWRELTSGEHVVKKVGFRASIADDWVSFKPADGFMMTKDGYSLNHISVKKIKFMQRLAYTNKRFQKNMILPEILELEIDSIQSNKQISYLNIKENKPVVIDGIKAYRLEYDYLEKNGLKVKAIQCGFIYNNFVYRIIFKAAKIHYYEKAIEDFERFLETFRLIDYD